MHFYNLLFHIPTFLAWILCILFFVSLSGLVRSFPVCWCPSA